MVTQTLEERTDTSELEKKDQHLQGIHTLSRLAKGFATGTGVNLAAVTLLGFVGYESVQTPLSPDTIIGIRTVLNASGIFFALSAYHFEKVALNSIRTYRQRYSQ